MDPRQYYDALRRHWRILAASVVIAAAVGFVSADRSSRDETYVASHTITRAGSSAINLDQLALRLEGGSVPKRAARKLAHKGPTSTLVRQITVQTSKESGTLVISTEQPTPERAAAVVDAFGTSLVDILAEQAEKNRDASAARTFERLAELKEQIDDLGRQIAAATPVTVPGRPAPREGVGGVIAAQRDALIDQYRLAYERLQALANAEGSGGPIQTLEAADAVPAPTGGFEPPRGRVGRTIFVAVLGFIVGSVASIVLDRMDTRLRTKEATEAAFGVPVLAEVPMIARYRRARLEITAAASPSSRVAEAYRILRTTLLFLSSGPRDNGSTPNGEVILVTSPGASEGKTTTVANLAATFAETGRSVIVLDCDLRRPRLHEIFHLEDAPGFPDALSAQSPEDWFREAICQTQLDGVEAVVSPHKVDNPSALIPVAKAAIEAARRRADVVIVDTAPVLAANDAVELARLADAVVVVARSGRTEAASAARTTELLDRVGAVPVGAVLVAAPEPRSSYYSYTQYYGGRQPTRSPQGAELVPVAATNGEVAASGTADDGSPGYGAAGTARPAPVGSVSPARAGDPDEPERPRTLARSLADFLLRYDERYER